jgi:hypothetical protein
MFQRIEPISVGDYVFFSITISLSCSAPPKELLSMSCPPFETLIDYAEGRLTPDRIRAVEQHLAGGCGACASAVEWHRAFVSAAETDRSFDPPAWVLARAHTLFVDAKEAAANRGLRGLLNRIRAVLVFDSFADSLADAIPARSVATENRQLLYSVAPYDIDLLVTPFAPDRVTVTAQILTSNEAGPAVIGGLTVEFVRGDAIVATTETSEFGEFKIENLPVGTCDILIRGEHREIVVPEALLALQ